MDSSTLLSMFVCGLLVIAGGCARSREESARTQQTPISVVNTQPAKNEEISYQAGGLHEDWGIEVQSARLSAGGYMVDFRFRVLDAVKAAQIFDRKIMPYLIDQATGAKFIVPSPPKVGQLRSGGNIKEDRVYFIFFANPARYVKSGNKVTIVVGDFRAEDVVVY